MERIQYDVYGGVETLKLTEGSRFFTVAQKDGVWWLVTPNGTAFISKGVTRVNYLFSEPVHRPDGYEPYTQLIRRKYPEEQAWAAEATDRLKAWGFNTLGSSSHPVTWGCGMPYLINLHLAIHAGGAWLRHLPDVFSPTFAETVDRVCAEECTRHADSPFLIGYFTDNELGWRRSPLTDYLSLPEGAPGRIAAERFLAERGGEEPGEESPLHEEFREQVARRYFRICHEAIRKHDKHHLILGVRFANGYAPESVLRAMDSYVDVLTVNSYEHDAPVGILTHMHEVTDLPIMLTEFSFKAMDSGHPNAKGAGIPVQRQEDRAAGFERFVTGLMNLPFVVGYQWFQYMDQPKTGRFDGENCNYGLVTFEDEPWEVLTERAALVNARVELIHTASS